MDKEKILAVLREFLGALLSELYLVIWYGHRPGRDIDLMVMLRVAESYRLYREGLLDILLLGQRDFEYMLTRQDPVVTEAVLTGEEIFGSEKLSCYRQQALTNPIHPETVPYLLRCAGFFRSCSYSHWQDKNFSETANACRFATSYLLYARHYDRSSEVLTFSELRDRYPEMLLKQAEVLAKSAEEINSAVAWQLLNAVQAQANSFYLTEISQEIYPA